MTRKDSNNAPVVEKIPEFLTTGQVAALFGVSFKTVIRWAKGGRLPCARLPGKRGDRRFSRECVLDFARKNHLDSLVLEDRRKPLVLIADDEPNVISSIERVLRGLCDIATATDGYQAGVIMGLRKPTLVLLDLQMPNLDGFAVLNYAKTVAELESTPVWIVSGCPEEVLKKAIEAGASGTLAKPFSATQILQVFHSACAPREEPTSRKAA